MANKSNRCFHNAGLRSSTDRNVRHRRLRMEHIEDRLLLAGDFWGGMEYFTIPSDNTNYIVVCEHNHRCRLMSSILS